MSKSFKVGDVVTWKSQAAGSWKTKTGTVIEIVPAFKIPRDKNFGSSRKHESYIVEVTYEPKRAAPNRKGREGVVRTKKPERFWPRVSNLRFTHGKTLAEVFAHDQQQQDTSYSNIESTN